MANVSATISIGANTSLMENQIAAALNRAAARGANLSIGPRNFASPFAAINRDITQFTKSLELAENRVLAFSSTVGIVYQVSRAFSFLISSTLEVEKQLATINSVLGASSEGLKNFGNDLFAIARNTGTTFQQVATAATEFSRQGLGLNETLKRTRDALILSRLSGLDVVQSTEAMTAAINSFSKAALDSSDIVNKLANVDAKFAVSSSDLAQAVQRVGSSAADAGVSFDELLGIVTSVQQTTARGGAVIGNALKTIFTRIQNPAILSQLDDIGVKAKDAAGNVRPAIEVLKQLTSTFDSLDQSSRAQISQLLGGVYQINILKAALSDLGKEYSIVDRATKEAGDSTNQAALRNQELNKTISSQINETLQNLTNLASKAGSVSFGPQVKDILTVLNSSLTQLSEKDSQDAGSKIGSGILKGIGDFITGPGLLIASYAIGVLVKKFTSTVKEAGASLLGLQTQATQQKSLYESLNSVIAQNPQIQKDILLGERSRLAIENELLAVLKQQNAEAQRLKNFSQETAKALIQSGASNIVQSLPPKTSSLGHIPKNYAFGNIPEETKIAEVAGAIAGGYRPGKVIPAPKEVGGVMNDNETVKYVPGLEQPFINPPKNSIAGQKHKERSIKQLGIDPYASFGGYVPNFAARFDLPRIKNSEIQKRLEQNFLKGQDYKDYYNILGTAFSNPEDATTYGDIASALSPRVPDYVASPAAVAVYKYFQQTGSQNVDDYLDLPINVQNYRQISQLGFFGERGARRFGLGKALRGETLARNEFDKTRQYASAIAGDESAFPIDTNILRTVFGRTVEGSLKPDSARKLIRLARETATGLGVQPRQLQAGVFKGANERFFDRYDLSQVVALRDSLIANDGFIPNFAGLGSPLLRAYRSTLKEIQLGKFNTTISSDVVSQYGDNYSNVQGYYAPSSDEITLVKDKLADRYDAANTLAHEGVHQIINRFDKERDVELGNSSLIIPLKQQLQSRSISFNDNVPRNERLEIPSVLRTSTADIYGPKDTLEEAIADGTLATIKDRQTLSPFLGLSVEKLGKVNQLFSRLRNVSGIGTFTNKALREKFQSFKGYVPNFKISQKELITKLTPEILSTFTQGKDLLKYIKSLGVDPYADKGSSRSFIPLSRDTGLKIALGPAGVAQNEVEFPILNTDQFAKQHYSDILPEGKGFDENNFLYGFVERLKKPTSEDFQKITGKRSVDFLPRPSIFRTGPLPELSENELLIEDFINNFGLENDFSGGRNTGIGKSTAGKNIIKLLDIGFNQDIGSKFYNNRLLGLKGFNNGFIPNFDSIEDAKNREIAAGYSSSQVKVGYDNRLDGGLGVYNTTEGSLQQAINLHLAQGKTLSQIQTQGSNAGFTPNFAGFDSFDIGAVLFSLGILKTVVKDVSDGFKTLTVSSKDIISAEQAKITAIEAEIRAIQQLAIDSGAQSVKDQRGEFFKANSLERESYDTSSNKRQEKIESLRSNLGQIDPNINKRIQDITAQAEAQKDAVQKAAAALVEKNNQKQASIVTSANQRKSDIDTNTENAIAKRKADIYRSYLSQAKDINKDDLTLSDIRSEKGSNLAELNNLKRQLAEAKTPKEKREIKEEISTRRAKNVELFKAERTRVGELKQNFLSQDQPFIQQQQQAAQVAKGKVDASAQTKLNALNDQSFSALAKAESSVRQIDVEIAKKIEQLKAAGIKGSTEIQAEIDVLVAAQKEADLILQNNFKKRAVALEQGIASSGANVANIYNQARVQRSKDIGISEENIAEAQKPLLKQNRFSNFIKSNGFAIGQTLSIGANIASQFVPEQNKKAQAVVEGIGDVGNFAGAGAIFGPIGLGIGAVVGGFFALNKVLDADVDKKIYDLNKQLDALKETSSRASDSIGNYISNTEALNTALSDPKTSENTILRIQKNIASELSKIPDQYRAQILAANGSLQQLQTTFSEINEELKKQLTQSQSAADIAQIIKNNTSGTVGRFIGADKKVFENNKEGNRSFDAVFADLTSSIDIKKITPGLKNIFSSVGDDSTLLVTALKKVPGVSKDVAESFDQLVSGQGDVEKLTDRLSEFFDIALKSSIAGEQIRKDLENRKKAEEAYQATLKSLTKDLEFLSAQFSSAFESAKSNASTITRLNQNRETGSIRLQQERVRGQLNLSAPFLSDKTRAIFEQQIKDLGDTFDKNNKIQDVFNNSQAGIVDIVSKKFLETSNKVTENAQNAGENFNKPAQLAESARDTKIRDALVPAVSKAISGLRSGEPIDTGAVLKEITDSLNNIGGKDFTSSIGELTGKINELLISSQNEIKVIKDEFDKQKAISEAQLDYQKKYIDLQAKLNAAGGPSDFLSGAGKTGASSNLDKLTTILENKLNSQKTGGTTGSRADFQLADFILNNLGVKKLSSNENFNKENPGLANLQESAIQGRAQDLGQQFAKTNAIYGLTTGKKLEIPNQKDLLKIARDQVSAQLKLENMPDDISELRDSAQVLNQLIESQGDSIEDKTKKAFLSALTDAGLANVDNDINNLGKIFEDIANKQNDIKFQQENKIYQNKVSEARARVSAAQTNVDEASASNTGLLRRKDELQIQLSKGSVAEDLSDVTAISKEIEKIDEALEKLANNKKNLPIFKESLNKAQDELNNLLKSSPQKTVISSDFIKENSFSPESILGVKGISAPEVKPKTLAQITSQVKSSRVNRADLAQKIDNTKEDYIEGKIDNATAAKNRTALLGEYTKLMQESADYNFKLNDALKDLVKNDPSRYVEEYADQVRKANEAAIRAGKYRDVKIGEQIKANYGYTGKEFQRDQFSLLDDFSRDFKSGISGAFSEAIKGTKTLREAFFATFEAIGNKLTDKTVDIAVNGLFSAGTSLVSKNADGGLIQKFSKGGRVIGGSGNRDDVPAMMNGGEFVIRKSSVQKYGVDFLDQLNAGGLKKRADGGSFSQVLDNKFVYNDGARPTGGSYVVDSKLSALALTDENNPQNKIKESRYDKLDQYLIDYAAYIQQRNTALKNYQNKAKGIFYQGLINAGITVGAAAIVAARKGSGGSESKPNEGYDNAGSSSTAATAAGGGLMSDIVRSSGFIPTFAGGGSNKDDVPALLMGGEYVLNKGAVKTYGTDFLNRLNRGQLPKFASGGVVGQGFNTNPVTGEISPQNGNVSDSSDKIDDLVQSLNDLIDILSKNSEDSRPSRAEVGKSDSTPTTGSGSSQVVSNVSITINDSSVSNSSSNGSATSDQNSNADKTQNAQQVSKLIEAKVLEIVTNQLRPGGLLYRTQDKSR